MMKKKDLEKTKKEGESNYKSIVVVSFFFFNLFIQENSLTT